MLLPNGQPAAEVPVVLRRMPWGQHLLPQQVEKHRKIPTIWPTRSPMLRGGLPFAMCPSIEVGTRSNLMSLRSWTVMRSHGQESSSVRPSH